MSVVLSVCLAAGIQAQACDQTYQGTVALIKHLKRISVVTPNTGATIIDCYL